ncbi:hypothetical protein SCP_0104700 [Sparassis crispa]|uniref:Uncharacterized protein n=1 Tax=Sparassis crispa TaxID=139825 RepID=A0A401G602_9APHY|nr:hypothetical protein SCP_0104700 [Sparassis crispa]GBE77590.1 hypothetical protein SCP_0104700 [Sparassis crispa]
MKTRCLTLNRNEFLSCFVTDAVLSVIDNIVNGSKEMDPVLNLVKRDTVNARGMAKTFTTLRDKPLTHCENCGKSPEDFGRDTRFMVCSTCKSKLHFSIHYCSQETMSERRLEEAQSALW